MICGLGTDVVEISRIERLLQRFKQRFIQKVLSSEEIEALEMRGPIKAHTLAARFAAKEAAVKALGTGFNHGVGLHDIHIFNTTSGAPEVQFHGNALKIIKKLGVTHSHISLSHGRDIAQAVVILERNS